MEDTSILEKRENKIHFKPILLFVGLFILEIVSGLLISYIVPSANPMRETIVFFLSKIICVVVAVIVLRDQFKESAIMVKKKPLNFIVYLVIAFVAFYLVELGTSYYSMFMDKLFEVGESTNQSGINEMFKNSPTTLNYVLLFMTVVIIAPILEELEFRVCTFEGLKGLHFLIPLFLSSTLFGLIHMSTLFSLKEWAYFPMYALPGLAFGIVYYFGGRNLFVDIACHSGINLIAFIQIVTLINKATEVVEI